ncbi:hypothetical protein Zmor_026112 [Zophobas morio]|uniref:Uncharacterized protein n=1 Tax=Zophobas morio TaxID=2755281 RepID=A0AA38HTJ8_9CUCU|nr:hypothetical protein Zmor_026112 [Zophobas morio]
MGTCGIPSYPMSNCSWVLYDIPRENRKTAEGKCMYCDEIDDAEQTIFLCHRWQRKRAEAEMVTRSLIVENLVEKMLESEENWTVIENFLVGVMKRKGEHERVEKLV